MLNQPTFEKLVQMRLGAMDQAFHQQTEDPNMANLSFEERFGMLVDGRILEPPQQPPKAKYS